MVIFHAGSISALVFTRSDCHSPVYSSDLAHNQTELEDFCAIGYWLDRILSMVELFLVRLRSRIQWHQYSTNKLSPIHNLHQFIHIHHIRDIHNDSSSKQ